MPASEPAPDASAAPATRILLARSKIQRGEYDDALKVLSDAFGSMAVWPWHAYAQLRAKGGDLTDVERSRFEDTAERADAGVVGALLWLQLGNTDETFRVLDRRLDANDPDLIRLRVDPEWAPPRQSRQFLRRLARVCES